MDEALDALVYLRAFRVQTVFTDEAAHEAFRLAALLRRPVIYDSMYVALARVLDCDLWTADRRLVNALRQHGLSARLVSEYELR